MNYLKTIVIAIALIALLSPVSAVFENGNWLSSPSPNGNYDSVTEVTSKIVPTDMSIPSDGCGEINIQTLTYHALIGSPFTIQRINATDKPFVNGERVAKEVSEAYPLIGEAHNLELDHNGRYNDRVVPGTYLITLPDGNGGQPEYALVEVVLSQVSNVVFLGHGVSMGGEKVACLPVFTIISAEYCGTTIPAVTHTIHHPAVEGHVAYYTVEEATWIPEVGHWEGSGYSRHWHIDTPARWNGNCEETNSNNYAFKVGNQRYILEQNGDDLYTLHAAVHGRDAYDEVIIDTNAVPGGCADVKSNVQSVVDKGINQFLFNNAKSGIYDATGNLVSGVKDPAVNIIKHISMKYNRGCGSSDIKVEFEEYQLFDITTGLATKPEA